MTLEEIAVYGFYALLIIGLVMAPVIGLALYALYWVIKEE